ncbi:MAG: choice-of-anchor I family protein [Bacteroidota bacterium]|nr:T9SS type A sorting domain-containing protein [Candidatus Kapabacteria bacterium]MDW8219122.1 choice-of-anchor I family protein [Bacteroidota bacterium]
MSFALFSALWAQTPTSQGISTPGSPQLRFLSRWQNPLPPQGAGGLCESIAYDPQTRRLFIANSLVTDGRRYVRVEVVNLDNPLQPVTEASLDFSAFGADVSSIAVSNGILAAAMIQAVKTDSGRVVFVDVSSPDIRDALRSARSVVVGAQPDMITFTPDGSRVLTANEGEPTETGSYLPDPEGSVSIITLPLLPNGRVNLAAITQANVRFVRFNEFNVGGRRRAELLDSNALHLPSPTTTASVPGAAPGRLVTLAQDLEPEYIAVSPDSRIAYVTLQENNAWAIIDIAEARVIAIRDMGLKYHILRGNGLDASDRGTTINIANYPVLGMYQPDALQAFTIGRQTFIASVNEGDTRGYATYNEEVRVGTLRLDSARFPNRAFLQQDTVLGRLNVTRARGDFDGDGDFDALYVPGGRSIAIWNGGGTLVWDSGDEIEQITARALPSAFNVSRDNVTRKNRSDDKGPEPEGIAVGTVGDSTYIFAGLERTSGIIVYNATNPFNPKFVQYITTRDYSRPIAGDVSTEALLFIPASQNRLNIPLVIASYEVSGTVAVFAFEPPQPSPRLAASDVGIRTSYLSNTVVRVDVPVNTVDAVTISVSDIQGRLLEHHVHTGTQNQSHIQHIINFDGKQPGAYLLTIEINGKHYTETLVIGR